MERWYETLGGGSFVDSPLPDVQTPPARPRLVPPLQDALQDAPRRDRCDKTLRDADRDASKTLQDVSKMPRDALRRQFYCQDSPENRPHGLSKGILRLTSFPMWFLIAFFFNFWFKSTLLTEGQHPRNTAKYNTKLIFP